MAAKITELNKKLLKEVDDSKKIKLQAEIKSLQDKAEHQIRSSSKDMYYNVREWDIHTILDKYETDMDLDMNELFIPDYQRDYKWSDKTASRFIESILLGFPIPYLYTSDVQDDDPEKDGRVEIIDGSQRIRALHYFVNNQFPLKDLKELINLEGFCFSDFTSARKRRFKRCTLRIVELIGDISESNRRDIFERVNSGVKQLEDMEVRHGSDYAVKPFYLKVLTPCSEDEIFSKLAPLSDIKKRDKDHLEFVLRYFAYKNNLDNYAGSVKPFLDAYLKDISFSTENYTAEDLQVYIDDFKQTLAFIDDNFGGLGFKKTLTSKTTPRARYEAIAVGVALALAEEPQLKPAVPVSSWLTSEEFQSVVGADSANNTSQLLKRINFVKNKLLTGE